MTRELTTKSPSGRPKRVPISEQKRLSIHNRDPNYHYRIVNTTDAKGHDKIQAMLLAGYEIDKDNAGKVGDARVDQASGLGSVPEFSVGQGVKAIVMRIPKEWYAEDQAAKQAQVDAGEETMHQNARKASDYGEFRSK